MKNCKIVESGWLFFIPPLILSCVMISQLDTLSISDELGTMANAAYFSNQPWVTAISNSLAYYKYGQSLLYIPLFKLFTDVHVIYKGALLINSVIISFIPVLAFQIIKKYCTFATKSVHYFLVLTIGLLPAALLWSKTAMNDSMLMLLPWVGLLLLLRLFCEPLSEKNKQWYLVLLAFVAAYSYMVHVRGIVMIIAISLSLVFICKKKHIKPYSYIVVLIVFLVIDYFLSAYLKNAIWGTQYLNNTLEYTIDSLNISKIFSIKGIKGIIKVALGWLFSENFATLGTFGIGVFGGILLLIRFFRTKEKDSSYKILLLFVILLVIGNFLLGILYFSEANYDIIYGGTSVRLDRILYTRYVDSALGLTILCAFIILIDGLLNRLQRILVFVLQAIICVGFVFYCSSIFKSGSLSVFMISTQPFLIEATETGINSINNLQSQFIPAGLLFIVISFMLLFFMKSKAKTSFIIAFPFAFLVIIAVGFLRCNIPMNNYYAYETEAFSEIIANYETTKFVTQPIVVNNARAFYAFQFRFPNVIIKRQLLGDERNYMILDSSFNKENYSNEYLFIPTGVSNHYAVLFGDELILDMVKDNN